MLRPIPQCQLPDGPFTPGRAAADGISRQQLRQLVRDKQVRRVLRGVYQDASLSDTLLNRAEAAALVVSPYAVVCDRTAAWLHGVDVFEYRDLEILPPLETFVLRDHARIRRAGTRGGERDLNPADVIRLHGVRVTTPRRTALDLGCLLPRRDALSALDGFMRVHDLTREDYLSALPRYFRRRGVRQLRGLVMLADPRAESPGESWTRLEIVDAGLPVPQLQWSIRQDGRELYRLDLAYPRLRVCVEYDGEEFHDSPARREGDAKRREWLRQRGWTVIVVDKTCFSRDAVTTWTREIRRAIRL